MGREEGGGFRMGSMGIPVVGSFRCLAKLIQYCKVKKKKKKESLPSIACKLCGSVNILLC